jgi:hypothetical protein
MSRQLKRRLAAAVAVLAVLAGGAAVALGANGGDHPGHAHRAGSGQGLIATASAYLGIGRAQLEQDLRSGRSLAEVATATPGRSEAGLVSAILADRRSTLATQQAKLPERVAALIRRSGTTLTVERRARHSMRAATLAYLGLSRQQLNGELRKDRSLAQIAAATPGKSAAGLVEAILAGAKQRLQASSRAGRISSAQAQAKLARLRLHATEAVERTRAARAAAKRKG